MAYRSPPPHKRSSGNRGGASDFEKWQRELAQTVKRVGFDNLPINDETLRPFLLTLWGFGQAQKEKIWSIDTPGEGPPGRIFQAIVGPVQVAFPLSKKLHEILLEKFAREEIKRAKPVFQLQASGTAAFYFSGVWTPVEALGGQRH